MVKIQELTLTSIVVQSPGSIVSDMDGEKVMININNGKYYNLGEVGGVIWDLIKAPIAINQLITAIISEYSVEQADCEEQVGAFLSNLSKEGLIQIVNSES